MNKMFFSLCSEVEQNVSARKAKETSRSTGKNEQKDNINIHITNLEAKCGQLAERILRSFKTTD